MILKKKQIIVLVAVVLIFAAIICWGVMSFSKISGGSGENGGSKTGTIPGEEVFTLTGTVESVNAEGGYLFVVPSGQDFKVKVFASENTELIKLAMPSGASEIEDGQSFSLEQLEIEISDFTVGDPVYINSNENIAGKSEINNANLIQILI